MENKKNTNIAVAIGFILILLIAAITIIRPQFSKKTTTKITPASTEKDPSPKDSKQITGDELLKLVTSNKKLAVIDVRAEDAFKLEHLANSQNIPLDSIEMKVSALDKNKDYVIIDSGSQEGMPIALQLFPQSGLKNTYYLQGGFPDWKQTNNPTVSAGDPTSFVDQSKVTYINSEGLKALIEKDTNLLLIDLHNADDYKKERIKGAINIPLSELENRKSEIPLGKKIVFYDRNGLWAFQAAVRFFDLGFFNTLALSDGLDGWKQKNYPLEK